MQYPCVCCNSTITKDVEALSPVDVTINVTGEAPSKMIRVSYEKGKLLDSTFYDVESGKYTITVYPYDKIYFWNAENLSPQSYPITVILE